MQTQIPLQNPVKIGEVQISSMGKCAVCVLVKKYG